MADRQSNNRPAPRSSGSIAMATSCRQTIRASTRVRRRTLIGDRWCAGHHDAASASAHLPLPAARSEARDRLGAGAGAELPARMVDMEFDRRGGDAEDHADLPIGLPRRDPPEALELARA